jgi:Flp pilus assembly protein TadD
VSSMNNTPSRCAAASLVAITLLAGCQLPAGLSNPLAQSDKAKQSWTSKIARNLKSGSKTETLDPIAQQMALARSLESQGKTAEAIYTYSTILAKEEGADAHHRLAVLHDKSGNFKASEEHYQVALKLEPKNAELLCDRGYSYLLQDRLEEAQENLEKAIKRDSDLTRAHNNMGLLLAQQGHVDRALVEFAAAGCSHAEARTNLAYALTMAGNVDDAQYHLEIARQADASLLEAGQLKYALGQHMISSAPESGAHQAVDFSPPGKPRKTSQTTPQRSPETSDRQIVALPPTEEQRGVESSGQLIDYQIAPSANSQSMPASEAPVTNQQFDDILRMSANVEPDPQQQLSQRKQAQLRRALDRLDETDQIAELEQPHSLRAFDSQ